MAILEEKLAALEVMTGSELRDHWRVITGSPVPQVSPKMMRLALAWELQAQALGGLSRQPRQRLDQLERGQTRTVAAALGARLVREWGGKAHVVTIDEDRVTAVGHVARWSSRRWTGRAPRSPRGPSRKQRRA